MSTVKATQNLQLLDAARCNGEWEAVPELSRKVQKHAPGRKCLAIAAHTESKLHALRSPPRPPSGPAFDSYVASLDSLQKALQAELNAQPTQLPKLPNPVGGNESSVVTEGDLLQARIVLASICSKKGEWNEVLNIVPGEAEVGEGFTPGPGKADYMNIMRLKALVLKGVALSRTTTDTSLSLQVYRAATRLYASFSASQPTSVTLAIWAEKALGFYALATYGVWFQEHATPTAQSPASEKLNRDGEESPTGEESETEGQVGVAIGNTIVDESTLASALRTFHKFVNGTSSDNRATSYKEKRKDIYRCYFMFLSLLLLPPGHADRPLVNRLPPGKQGDRRGSMASAGNTLGRRKITSNVGTPDQLREELKTISTVYESHLLLGLKFPRADEYHEAIGEWADQVVENWRVSGGSAEDAAPVVGILYRASKKSFHSPRILRHLFYTLTATGNFQDALAALSTYLDLIQKAMERISKGNHERDFDSHKTIFHTAVEGVRVLCKFTGNAPTAMEVATKMEKWIGEWGIRDKEILAEVYRGIGMANSAFARQTSEGERRPGAQQAAVIAFRKGLSYDPIDTQGWYGLALVEAEMRSVENAMESARKGLGALKYNFMDNEDPDDREGCARDYKRFAVPLLHLLALLMTAKEDFETAEKVCRNAFDIVGEGRNAVADLGVSDKVAIFELRMSQLAIMEAVEDSETAASMAEDLLALYGMLFDGTHLVQRQQQGDAEENVGDVSNPSRPTTTTSRRSRLPWRNHKKQFSASHSSLPRQVEDPGSPPSQGGTVKKRPQSGHQSLTGMSTGMPTNAPKIQVIDDKGGAATPPSEKTHRKMMRPSSVSGSTVRRMRSLGSLKLRHEPKLDEPPTPPLPSSTEASSLNFDSPAGSMRDGKDPHLFQTLKNKLHHHHLKHPQAPSATGSVTSIAETIPGEITSENRESTKAENVPNNLPQHKLPYPLCALGRTISDDGQDGRIRTLRRPIQLPEPKLAVAEESKQVLGALRRAWLCVAGLYRRAGYFGDALMATEEANGLVGKEGEGEADVLAEQGFLAMVQGRRTLAAELFEQALALDYDHPQSIVGLSKLLLKVKDMDPEIDAQQEESAPDDEDTEARTNKLASRDRALGLLEKLVVSPRGWDLVDGWFLLADALEKGGEVERAKAALWRVVELEDGTGVRGWRACGVGVV